MTRTWFMAVALLAAGCKAPAPSIDPFFGRSTVPPPALGASAPPAADNAYYSGASAAPGPGGRTTAGGDGTAARPVSRRQQGADAAERVEPEARPATRSLRSAGPEESPPRGSTQQLRAPALRSRQTSLQGDSGEESESTSAAPGRFAARGPLRRMSDSADDEADEPTDDAGVRQAGFVELPARGESGVRRDGGRAYATGSLRYDRDPDYAWLRGRLEYSPTADQWKLRYIPIDGATDDYGGSVIIADEAAVRDFRHGSFVDVHGQIEGRNADARVVAPYYRVESIEAAE